MNKKKFELQFDAKMEISDIKKQLGVLNASLDKLEIPANMTKNLEKALKKTLDQLAEFETRSEKGIENLADAKKLEKAWSQITDSLDDIGAILKTLDTSGLFPKEVKKNIESAERALAGYIQKLDQAKKSSVYQVEEKKRDDSLKDERAVQNLLDKAKKKQMSAEAEFEAKKGSWSEDAQKRYSAEQAEIEDINNKLKDQLSIIAQLEKKKDKLVAEGYMTKTGEVSAKARDNVNRGTGDGKKLKRAESVAGKLKTAVGAKKGYEGMLKDAKNRAKGSEALEKEYKDAERAVQETSEAVEQLTTKLQEAKDNTKQLEQNMENIARGEAASAWAELVDLLQKITGLDLNGAAGDIEAIRNALQNYKQGELEKAPETINELKRELKETEGPAKNVKEGLSDVASTSEDLERAADEVNRLKQQILDFFSISNAIDIFKRALSSAFDTVKELDAVMTEAAVVTDFSIGDMWEQMPQYSKNASELGVATKELYAATTLYYQQGLKGNDVMKIGAETMKMAKIASMDAAEATQAMTAALRGFNMEVNEMNAQKVNDVYSKLAAITAADTSQIATAMSKTASIAASANMEFETTAAFLAQIIETTQEAPETAGTALKTIIARFSEVKELQGQGLTTGVDAEGEAIDINKISTALRSVGISMDAFFAGQEGLDEVLLRLSEKWNTLDFQTQHYIATTAAGSRQQSRFMAMMSNYGRTMELVSEANDSAGASQEQYEKTLESLDSKLAQLKNAWDQFTMGLANNEVLKAGVDALTWILETVNKLTDAISGGNGLVKSLASLTTVIGALKLGGKILGKNSTTGGLLGKVGGMLGVKDNSKQEYQRGVKDGYAYGKGQVAGYNKATKKIPAPEFEGFDKGKKNAEDLASGFNKVGLAVSGAGLALGLLSAAFESAGMEEAAEITGILAATFTAMSVIIPIVGKLFTALGGEAAMAGVVAQLGWGWISAIALAITAIIAGIAVVVSSAMKAAKERSLEYKLEQAQKATENAKKAAEEAKAAYDDLLDRKSGYSKLQDDLKNLTKGTKEWRAALVESNQQVLALIDKYPDLAAFVSTGEHGEMFISEAGWEFVQGEALRQSQGAQAAYVGASINQTDLELQNQMSETAGDIFSAERLQELYKIAQISDKAAREQALQNKIAELERLRDNAGSGSHRGSGNRRRKAYEDQIAYLQGDFDNFIKEYDTKMEQYTKQIGGYTQALLLYADEKTQESEHYPKVSEAIAKYFKETAYSKILTEQQTIKKTMSEDEIKEAYTKLTGQMPTEEQSVDELAMALASDKVAQNLSNNVDTVTRLIESRNDESTQRIMAAAISGDTSGLSMSELATLQNMSYEDIAVKFGYARYETGDFKWQTGLTQDQASKYQDDYQRTYDDLIEGIGQTAYTQNKDFFDSSSIESVQKIVGFFEQGELKSSRQKGAFVDAYTEVMKDRNVEETDKVVLENLLTSADWTDPLKAMDIMDTMLSMGIDQGTIQKYWKVATAGVDAYVDSETEALQLAGRMQGKVKNLSELSNRMAEGTMTLEDVMALEKAGVNTSGYKLTAEGWQATSEEIEEATEKMREFYLMQTEANLKDAYNNWLREIDPAKREELWQTYEILKKTREMLKQPITTTYKVETHIDLLDRIKEAIVFDRQKEIDKLSEINDTIADSNSRIVTAMRESVEDSRRMRENERTEQEIADKQARLSYLKMDTSGANAMEIKQLEEEIAQDQESYTDRLIDEKISALEEQNNVAQEQRAQQIELMRLQLEQANATGAFWGQVKELFDAAYNSETGKLNEDSEAIRLLQQAEGYQGLSAEAQQQWKNDLLSAFKEGVKVEIDVDIKFEPTGGGGAAPSRDVLGLGPGISKNVVVQMYASGGLADFTGPAWLDGTKTNPEYVLSAAQTERFFTLVDILEDLKVAPTNSTQNNRENNFDIDINVESINSDYDVEQVAIKVKDFIVNSSRYRNNNTL